ncbi:MAG: hypothetical protein GY811_09015 [Myxococcales bacterium]|nr:hypothetical protein [Myxococcales bacterium]
MLDTSHLQTLAIGRAATITTGGGIACCAFTGVRLTAHIVVSAHFTSVSAFAAGRLCRAVLALAVETATRVLTLATVGLLDALPCRTNLIAPAGTTRTTGLTAVLHVHKFDTPVAVTATVAIRRAARFSGTGVGSSGASGNFGGLGAAT